MTQIEGTVLDVIYRNSENGYTVLEMDCKGELTVAVGNMPLVQPGEFLRMFGAYTEHPNYGIQFKVAMMESRMPEGDESMRLFLASGMIKGVGEVIAARIVDAFHEETFEIIENEPARLAEVRGISENAAMRIHEQYMELAGTRTVIMKLQGMGLTTNQAMKVFEAYGAAAPYIVEQNPYRLADDIRGIGFEKADGIAAHMGVDKYSELRIRSGIKHTLRVFMERGHSCLPADMLCEQAAKLLDAEPENVRAQLAKLIGEGAVSLNIYNGVKAAALPQAYAAEAYSAMRLAELARSTPDTAVNERVRDEVLQNAEKLSEEQERAVLMATSSAVSVITGGPGTGKTTILNHIITIFERSGITTALAAPTGRAAKRMEKATLRSAGTIHRLLEYGMQQGEEGGYAMRRFARDEDNPLEADAIIVDETSMVDIFLMKSLLAAARKGARVVFTGDADQLPSVGAGNVLKDMIASGVVPVAKLTEVYRLRGNIALNAHKVNRGENIELYPTGDCVFMEAVSSEDALEQTVAVFTKQLDEGVPLDEIQIICPVKKGSIGVYAINKRIREEINPMLYGKNELTFGETVFRVGDKVMQMQNNYSKSWRLTGSLAGVSTGTGVFNGDIGIITAIDTDARTVEILFDNERLAEYEASELEQIEHAYAVTVHKSQGSEFDTVVIPLFYGHSDFLTRNLLYTAMTRAKGKLVLIGSRRTISYMTANSRTAARYTSLDHEIKKAAHFLDGLADGSGIIDAEYERISGIFEDGFDGLDW